MTFRTRNEARLELFRWIEGFYNARRRHSTLGYLSPDRFEEIMIKENKDRLICVST